jgi:hypothetical protein
MDPQLQALEDEKSSLLKDVRNVQQARGEALIRVGLAEEGWTVVEAEVRRRQEASDANFDAKIAFLAATIDEQYAVCDGLHAELSAAKAELARLRDRRTADRDCWSETSSVLKDMLAQIVRSASNVQEDSIEDVQVMASTDSALHKDLFELENATALLQRREQQLQDAIGDQEAKEDVIRAGTKEKLVALDEAAARQLKQHPHQEYFLPSKNGSAQISLSSSPASPSLGAGVKIFNRKIYDAPCSLSQQTLYLEMMPPPQACLSRRIDRSSAEMPSSFHRLTAERSQTHASAVMTAGSSIPLRGASAETPRADKSAWLSETNPEDGSRVQQSLSTAPPRLRLHRRVWKR